MGTHILSALAILHASDVKTLLDFNTVILRFIFVCVLTCLSIAHKFRYVMEGFCLKCELKCFYKSWCNMKVGGKQKLRVF